MSLNTHAAARLRALHKLARRQLSARGVPVSFGRASDGFEPLEPPLFRYEGRGGVVGHRKPERGQQAHDHKKDPEFNYLFHFFDRPRFSPNSRGSV